MIINKITIGFVVQAYDTDRNEFIGQDFIAGDEITWETQNGIIGVKNPPLDYLPYDMKQPEKKGAK